MAILGLTPLSHNLWRWAPRENIVWVSLHSGRRVSLHGGASQQRTESYHPLVTFTEQQTHQGERVSRSRSSENMVKMNDSLSVEARSGQVMFLSFSPSPFDQFHTCSFCLVCSVVCHFKSLVSKIILTFISPCLLLMRASDLWFPSLVSSD